MEYKIPQEQMPYQLSCEYNTSKHAGNTDFHLHNNYEIYVFLEGRIHYFVGESCYLLTPGSVMVFNNHEIHKSTNLIDQLHKRMVIHFNPAYIQPFLTGDTDLLACFQNRSPGTHNYARLSERDVKEITAIGDLLIHSLHDDSYGSHILSLTYLIQLLVYVNRLYQASGTAVPGSIRHRAYPIMSYINEHLADALTLESIGQALVMDKYYLSHLFKRETGSTVFQYILLKRIALAKELLADGLSVTEVCALSGFNDYSNFIRTFKKVTGYSPGKYKALTRNAETTLKP